LPNTKAISAHGLGRTGLSRVRIMHADIGTHSDFHDAEQPDAQAACTHGQHASSDSHSSHALPSDNDQAHLAAHSHDHVSMVVAGADIESMQALGSAGHTAPAAEGPAVAVVLQSVDLLKAMVLEAEAFSVGEAYPEAKIDFLGGAEAATGETRCSNKAEFEHAQQIVQCEVSDAVTGSRPPQAHDGGLPQKEAMHCSLVPSLMCKLPSNEAEQWPGFCAGRGVGTMFHTSDAGSVAASDAADSVAADGARNLGAASEACVTATSSVFHAAGSTAFFSASSGRCRAASSVKSREDPTRRSHRMTARRPHLNSECRGRATSEVSALAAVASQANCGLRASTNTFGLRRSADSRSMSNNITGSQKPPPRQQATASGAQSMQGTPDGASNVQSTVDSYTEADVEEQQATVGNQLFGKATKLSDCPGGDCDWAHGNGHVEIRTSMQLRGLSAAAAASGEATPGSVAPTDPPTDSPPVLQQPLYASHASMVGAAISDLDTESTAAKWLWQARVDQSSGGKHQRFSDGFASSALQQSDSDMAPCASARASAGRTAHASEGHSESEPQSTAGAPRSSQAQLLVRTFEGRATASSDGVLDALSTLASIPVDRRPSIWAAADVWHHGSDGQAPRSLLPATMHSQAGHALLKWDTLHVSFLSVPPICP
jgi:hypothetical protein